MQFKCPHCGADDVRKVSLMYEQATSNLNYREVSMRSDGVGAYTTGVGGIQNLMGGRIAPPEPPVPLPNKPSKGRTFLAALWALFCMIGFVVVITDHQRHYGAMFSYVVLGLPALFIVLLNRSELAQYPALEKAYASSVAAYERSVAQWKRAWICMRCGDHFEPNESTPAASQASTTS